MATYLHRLGGFAFRRRRLVLAVWLVVLAGMGVAAATLKSTTSNSFFIPGTRSQQAVDLLHERLPAASGATGRIVFAAPQGRVINAGGRAAIARALAAVERQPGVVTVSDPFTSARVSADGRVALAQVAWSRPAAQLDDDQVAAVRAAATRATAASGLKVEFGGAAGPKAARGGPGEAIGLAIAALVLAITFGSLLAAGMPLVTALIGVVIGVMGITAASGLTDLNASVPTLSIMLGLAVGVDYALFVVSRHRTHLHQGMDPQEAAALAVGTAGSAVVFAGATVVIALVALVVVGVPFLSAMGLAAAGTVAVAILVAITLLPALLGFAGSRIAKGKTFTTGPRATRPTLGVRWSGLVIRHRPIAIVAVVAILGAVALPALHMRLGLNDDSTASPDTTQHRAYALATAAFGPGSSGPLAVVVDAGPGRSVTTAAATVRARLAALPGVASVGRATINHAGDTAVISVVPSSAPSTTATKDLVDVVRSGAPAAAGRAAGADVLVTGQTATNIDVADRMGDALVPYLAVIVVLASLLLLLAFRSLLVPLTAIGGFLLTVGAALGAVTAVFQDGFAAPLVGVDVQAPITSLLPILIVGILFGLAMDYQVFLVSRMREAHVHGAEPVEAVSEGFRHGARVVTAAALIMVAVFAGFVLEDDPIIRSIGFALAFGILADAFLVRMTLIPALMAVLGRRAWWLPRRLDRVLPDVDLEGAALERRRTPAG